jgi:hypothetical protein
MVCSTRFVYHALKRVSGSNIRLRSMGSVYICRRYWVADNETLFNVDVQWVKYIF